MIDTYEQQLADLILSRVVVVPFPTRRLRADQDPMDVAAQRVHEAATDFLLAALEIENRVEVERIQVLVGKLIVELMAVQDSVGDRLNKLQERQ